MTGNCYVVYSVSKPGDYVVSIRFNQEHIPDSPFRVYVSPPAGQARKLSLASLPQRVMVCLALISLGELEKEGWAVL